MVELKIGDVVSLKSGGPNMVIEGVSNGLPGKICSCVWIYDGLIRSREFPALCLTLEKEDEPVR